MGPKKKLTRAEKVRMEMEKLEQARIQAELEAQRALEEERRRLERERKLATEKEKREIAEQALRVEQLSNSNALIKSMLDYSWNISNKEKADFEWEEYLRCDGLPNPTIPSEMTTYLHLWKEVIEDVSVDDAKHRTNEIIKLLEILEEFIDDPFDAPESLIANWKWVRELCREQQRENLDMATYRLLRDMDNRLNRLDIPTANYNIIDDNFILCLWLNVPLATPMHNPRAPPKKRLEINFPEMRLNVLFSTVLETKSIVIRTIYIKYDHLSDTCSTYDAPAVPLELDRELFEVTSREWYAKMKYKWDNRKRASKKTMKDEEGNIIEVPAEPEVTLRKGEVPPPVPYQRLDPTASRYAINLEGSKVKISEDNPEEAPSRKTSLSRKGSAVQQPSQVQFQDQGDLPDETLSTAKETKKKKKPEKDAFKNVSFENVVTPEEKAAKKAAKQALKKKKGKKGGEAAADGQTTQETDAAKTVDESAVQEEGKKESKKKDKGKKKGSKVSVSEGSKAESTEDVKGEAKGKKKKGKKGAEASKESLGEVEEKTDETGKKKGGKKAKKGKASETTISLTSDEGDKKKGGKKGKKGKASETTLSLTSDEGDKKKGGKKGKKGKASETTISLTSDEGDKKKDEKGKKGKKKGEKKGETKVKRDESEMEYDEDEDTDAKKKKKDKRVAKSVSFISEPRKKRKSGSVISRGKSATRTESSYSDMAELGGEQADYGTSLISFMSYPSGSGLQSGEFTSSSFVIPKGKTKSKSKKLTKFGKEEISTDELSPKQGKKEKKGEKTKEDEQSKTEVKDKKDKKKKGKKGKGGEPTAEEQLDEIMAQIMRLRAQAAQAAGTEVTEEQAPKEEKPKKGKGKKAKKTKSAALLAAQLKKMTPQERARYEQEKREQARIQAEAELQRLLEEERKRALEEVKIAKEKEKREAGEVILRAEQLSNSTALINNMLEYNSQVNSKEKDAYDWQQYLKCDGLPNPISPADMNTYLHLWEQKMNDVSVEEAKRRTNEIIELLQVLQDFIDDPFDVSESLFTDWKWVRALCREHQRESLDMTTYRLLRDIDNRLNRIDIPTADYKIVDENFVLCLWLYIQLATPMYNPRAPLRKPLEIDFPEMGMNVVFPVALDPKCMAIRAIYLKYDHLSDTCPTYDRPNIPAELDEELIETASRIWYTKMRYKWDHRKPPPKKLIEDADGNMIEVDEPEPEVAEGDVPPAVPYQKLEPSPTRTEISLEDDLYIRNRQNLEIIVEDKVVHLRKFLIIGGIYYLDLFYQPPQPHDQVAFDIRITALHIPKRLREVPFYIPYNSSIASDSDVKKQAEELEEELKQREAELENLILITLILPDHVMFLDLPIVCHWDGKRKVWTTEDIHDLKHIEEKNYITFRTGRFGAFALAVNRYINLPFQAWELKPELDGSVTFQLTCAILMVEFNVKNNRICLTQLQNSPNNALQEIVGTYYKLPKLMRTLQNGGVDLFPACDAFCYVEGACEKHWATEKHLYYNIAQLSPSYNFAWSRWNSQAGRRNIVLQMREYRLDKPKQKNHSMLLVTPLKANYIDTTEVSPSFNDTPIEGMKFYSDLYNLMKGTSSMATRNKIQNGPQDVAKTVADLLMMTRVLSFS